MDELEKVILSLDLCANGYGYTHGCDICPYNEERGHCTEDLMRDALNYLKQMEKQQIMSKYGWTGIEKDYPISAQEVIGITAETGALTTQARIRDLEPYKMPERWIPVSERLPERNMDCLFTVFEQSCECEGTLFPEETRTVFGTVRHYPNGRFCKRSWTWWEEDGMERTVLDEYSKEDWGLETFITAWKPLPEPYKGQEELRNDE